jgi:hypothetical protein
MNSGVLDLKMRRKVSLAPAVAGADVDSEAVAGRGAGAAIEVVDAKHKSAAGNSRTEFSKDTFIALLDAGNTYRRFMAARGSGSTAK